MSNTFLVKRGKGEPTGKLQYGELGFDSENNVLYIGLDGGEVIKVGIKDPLAFVNGRLTITPYEIINNVDGLEMKYGEESVIKFSNTEPTTAQVPKARVNGEFTLLGYKYSKDTSGRVNCEYIGGEE